MCGHQTNILHRYKGIVPGTTLSLDNLLQDHQPAATVHQIYLGGAKKNINISPSQHSYQDNIFKYMHLAICLIKKKDEKL